MKQLIIAALMLVTIQTLQAAEETAATEVFNKGVVHYINENKGECVRYMENAIALEPGNVEIIDFFLKILVEYGTESLTQNDFKKAHGYFKRAKTLDPANPELTRMIQLCVPARTEKKVVVQEKSKKENRKTLEKQKEKILKKYSSEFATIRNLITHSEKERNKLISNMNLQQIENTKTVNHVVIIAVAAIVFFGVLISFVTYSFARTASAKRETSLLEHQERILKSALDSQKSKELKTIYRQEYDPIPDIDPQVRERATRVELIEKELSDEKDPEIAVRLLSPYLYDKNNRVRANAAKALYPHDKNLSLKTLASMIANYDCWERASSLWALCAIGTPESIKIMLSLKNETNPQVVKRYKKHLGILLEKKSLPEQVKENIKRKLEQLEG